MTNISAQGAQPFPLVVLMLAVGAMGATMASPLFPIYEAQWGISHGTVTWLYVGYMAGVLAALLFLAQVADYLGPIRALRIGGGLMVAGLVLSALAGNVATLLPVRVLIGVASGIIVSAATLGLFRLRPDAGKRTALIASATTMAGFSLGPLLCGIVAQVAPWPLSMPYLMVMLPVAVLLACLLLLPVGQQNSGGERPRLMPNLGLPDRDRLGVFLVAAFAVFSAYAVFSLLASLAPSFLPMILPWHGPAISGAAVAVVLMFSAGVQFPARRFGPRITLPLALGLLTAGCLILAAAMRLQIAGLFLLADVLIGCGHGLSYLSGMTLVNLCAPPDRRSAVLSSLLCIGYMGTILPILAAGWLADRAGLGPAVLTFCAVFAVFCAGLCLLARRGAVRLDELARQAGG